MLIKVKDPSCLNTAIIENVYRELEQQGYEILYDSRDWIFWIKHTRAKDVTLLTLKYPHLEIAQVGL